MNPGVLLTAFGGPRTLDEVGPFIETMTGRKPSGDVVARSRAKYESIGGGSPLPKIADGIASAIEAELTERGTSMPVRLGMRYAEPRIDAALAEMVGDGVDTVVSLSLSPLESRITTQAYREAVAEAAADHEGLHVLEAPAYFVHPDLVDAHASSLRDGLDGIEADKPFVIFSAHSLPCEEMALDDTYVRQLRQLVAAVAEAAGLAPGGEGTVLAKTAEGFGSDSGPAPWAVAYQSRGYRDCAWLEPGLESMMDAAASAGHDGVVVSPVGFVTDHMETRYDLDIVAAEHAYGAGLAFVRTEVPNDDARLIGAFADTVLSILPGQEG